MSTLAESVWWKKSAIISDEPKEGKGYSTEFPGIIIDQADGRLHSFLSVSAYLRFLRFCERFR